MHRPPRLHVRDRCRCSGAGTSPGSVSVEDSAEKASARVKLDDQLLLQVRVDVGAVGSGEDTTAHVLHVETEPLGYATSFQQLGKRLEILQLTAARAHPDHLSHLGFG